MTRVISYLIEPANLERFRTNARAVPNRALYEFLHVARQLLGESDPLKEDVIEESVRVPFGAR